MFKPYAMFVGLRYTGAKRRSQLVSFISLVSMLGMTVGVALLIVVLSVMNGFDYEMRHRILGLVPHITIHSYGAGQDLAEVKEIIGKHPEVKAVAEFVQLNAMLIKGQEVEGVLVYGIDPQQERRVSIIDRYLHPGILEQLQDDHSGIVLGAVLAKKLGLTAGDAVNLMVPEENTSGRLRPRFKRLMVLGLLNTGTEIDQGIALINLSAALALQGDQSQGKSLRVSIKDTFAAPRVAWELGQNIPYGYSTRDWTRSHGNLYSAIQLSKQLVGMMLTTIIAVAAFNVVSALVMIVSDKRGDIAILRTLGASPRGIMVIFVMQGSLIGILGTLMGVLIGLALAYGVSDIVAAIEFVFHVQFLNTDVYPVSELPSDPRLEDVLLIAGTAILMSVIATLYPAWKAARVQPAQALRYE